VPSPNDNPANRKWTPPDEQRPAVDVNLDEKDASKAIARHSQEAAHLPESEDDTAEDRFLNRSRAVKKRIARIQRQFDQRLADQDAERQREIASLREEVNGLKTRKTEAPAVDEAAHERAIAALQSDLAAAHEAGESKKVAELTAKINRLEGEYWHKKTVAQLGNQTPAEPAKTPARQEQRPAARQNAADGATAEAKRWMRANEDWWEDPEFAGEKAYANATFTKLVQEEDMDADDPETYAELGKRVAKKFKDIEVIDPDAKRAKKRKAKEVDEDDEDEELEPRNRRQAPVMQVDRGNTPSVRRGRSVTLTASDVQNMKQFGLDPSNDKHVQRYAAEVQATNEA